MALALDVLSPEVLNAVAEEVARTNSILCSNNGSFEFCCDFNFFSILREERFLFGILLNAWWGWWKLRGFVKGVSFATKLPRRFFSLVLVKFFCLDFVFELLDLFSKSFMLVLLSEIKDLLPK